MNNQTILLVQPPYLRFVGSHNDRLPLELCYLNTYLHNAGFDSIVFNADWTGATKYIKWRTLFENFHYLQLAADGISSLYDETIERIVSFDPSIVVLSAADNVTSWVDTGNAYTTAFLSERLRSLGIYTIGIGPFYSKVAHKFIQFFDAILTGTASPSIIDIVEKMPQRKIVKGRPMSLFHQPPLIEVLPGTRDDVVMTSIGCPYTCTFCFAANSSFIPLPIETVIADVANRSADLIDFGDAILPLNINRLIKLAQQLAPMKKKFTCEVSVKSISKRTLEILCELGVTSVKMGIENADISYLERINKHQSFKDILKAVELVKKYDLFLNVYLLLGGPNAFITSAEITYDMCRQIEADDYIVNVLAFHDLEKRDFRYDAHFSQVLVEEWGLDEIIQKFFDLQSSTKYGLGSLI